MAVYLRPTVLTCSGIIVNLVLVCFPWNKIPVGNGNGPQTVLGHGLNHVLDQAILVGGGEALHLAPLADDEAALLHDDLGGALGVDPVAAGLQGNDCAHGFSGRVESVHFFELCIWHLPTQLK